MPQGAGRLASTLVTNGAATLTAFRVHAYDALGRPTEIGRSIAGAPDPEYVTGAEYDAAGRLATMRYPTTGGAATPGRVLHLGDSRVAAGAMREGIPLITNDRKFGNFLRAIDYPVEGF